MSVLAELAQRGRLAAERATPAERGRAAAYVLDTAGCVVAAMDHPLAGAMDELFRPRDEAARVFADSVLAHVDEMDAIHVPAAVLPCATVVPVALEVAAVVGAQGARLLDAVIAGSEVAVDAGLRFGGAELYAAGWWPSALFGGLGAAAAASVLLGLDDWHTVNALSLVSSGLGGLLSADVLGGGHYLLVGRAARDGLFAARAAYAGMTGSETLLDEPAAAALGRCARPPDHYRSPHLLDAAFKSYPCARPLHAMIEALRACEEAGADLAGAQAVRVRLPSGVLRFVTADPRPPGPTEAAASAVCALAAELRGRADDPAFFRDYRPTGRIPPVELGASAELDAAFPDKWGAEVDVVDAAGNAVGGRAADASGGAGAPLRIDQLERKFLRLVARRWHSEEARRWAEQCRDIEALDAASLGAWLAQRPRLAGVS